MDEFSVEMMILSLNAPEIQEILEPSQAIEAAHKSNDLPAQQIQKGPNRLAGLAALQMQDPDAPISQLQLCVKDSGFVGILVYDFSQIGHPKTAVYVNLK